VFFGGDKEPKLTQLARKISAGVADSNHRDRSAQTVAALVHGIRHMSALPPEVTEGLWSLLLTVGRKALTGTDPETMFSEIKAGCSADLIAIIEAEARR